MDHKKRVLNYYNATHIDYRALWSGSVDRAIHFGYYDEKATKHSDAVLRLNEILSQKAHIKQSDTVLDAGCGYGGSTLWLAQHISCKVTGITLVPLQARKGTKYIRERGLEENAAVLEMDFSKTSFAENSFDVYWALESLVHAESREVCLSEAYRLLKPGGRLIIAEYTLRERPPLTQEEKTYLTPWLNGWAMPELLEPQKYTDVLARAGFKNVVIENVTERVRPSIRRLEILSILNYPIAVLIGRLFFRKERLENYNASWRQINALKRNLWEYSIITAQK